MKEVDISKLNGKELYEYFTNNYPDADYSSVISLLPYAVMNDNKAFRLLERSVRENKKFYAYYPANPELNENIDISKMEEIGSIMDGAMYLG
jgi:shikimate kinase